jgi:hypothetical protein
MLIRIDERTKNMEEALDGVDEHINALYARTGKLENFRSWVIGIGAGIGSIASVLGALNLLGK